MKTTLPVYIDVTLKQRLANIKKEAGISASWIICDLLNKYLPQIEKKHNIELTMESETSSGVSKKRQKKQKIGSKI